MKNFEKNFNNFTSGLVIGLAIVIAGWMAVNWKAVYIAIRYPEAVKTLDVEVKYAITKK